MNQLLISIAVGATALLGGPARAADSLATGEFYADERPAVESVRIVCDEFGRCWREPRRRTMIIEDSYNSYNDTPREHHIEYAPRERYIERRNYRAPAADVDMPGVGVGGDRW